uniref:Uncharacterized protein n=1 Tax=Arundo donax TaxID=35708 RepID=A0A0A8ZBK4_ARUDO
MLSHARLPNQFSAAALMTAVSCSTCLHQSHLRVIFHRRFGQARRYHTIT